MKLKDSFLTHKTEDSHILLDVENNFSGIVKSNETAALVIENLKEETSIDNIVDQIYKMYDAPKETIKNDVENIIEQLDKINAIEH